MPTYVCRVSTGHPDPSDPTLGCEHSTLDKAVEHATLRNAESAHAMRTYVSAAGWTCGHPFPPCEIPEGVRRSMAAPIKAIEEGRFCNIEARAILVAMGMICLAPKQPS